MKRIRFMGRGRAGVVRKRSGHLNVTLAPVDFERKIADAPNERQRSKWEKRRDVARAARERVLGEFAFPVEAVAEGPAEGGAAAGGPS